MLRLGDAGLLLFVRPVCLNSEILGRRLVLLLEVNNTLHCLNSTFLFGIFYFSYTSDNLRVYPYYTVLYIIIDLSLFLSLDTSKLNIY